MVDITGNENDDELVKEAGNLNNDNFFNVTLLDVNVVANFKLREKRIPVKHQLRNIRGDRFITETTTRLPTGHYSCDGALSRLQLKPSWEIFGARMAILSNQLKKISPHSRPTKPLFFNNSQRPPPFVSHWLTHLKVYYGSYALHTSQLVQHITKETDSWDSVLNRYHLVLSYEANWPSLLRNSQRPLRSRLPLVDTPKGYALHTSQLVLHRIKGTDGQDPVLNRYRLVPFTRGQLTIFTVKLSKIAIFSSPTDRDT
ncbi:hypothetical protein TNCV_3947561 [Trichonephila clavipes]|nr:hypothetical protein TNCV_3947561 [Trichonephila clavipes]